MTYRPREDSLLLKQRLKELDLEGKRVLDMGTGPGILAVAAAKKAADVVASDVDPGALEDAESYAEEEGVGGSITFVESDLFGDVDGKFDLIVFNPPYLRGDDYLALEGGEGGVELTEKFLEKAQDYLERGGEILFIASSRSGVESLRDRFDLETVAERKLWFETLYLFKSD